MIAERGIAAFPVRAAYAQIPTSNVMESAVFALCDRFKDPLFPPLFQEAAVEERIEIIYENLRLYRARLPGNFAHPNVRWQLNGAFGTVDHVRRACMAHFMEPMSSVRDKVVARRLSEGRNTFGFRRSCADPDNTFGPERVTDPATGDVLHFRENATSHPCIITQTAATGSPGQVHGAHHANEPAPHEAIAHT